jgi:hypothetical protein
MTGFAEGTPTATVELGGKSYTLGFTLGAMRRAKELGVLHNNAESSTDMMLALPEYVWSCLSEEGRTELSVAQISELMNPSNVEAIAEAVGELFKASTPKPDPNVQPVAVKEPTTGNPSSKNSGQLVSTI